MNKLSKSSAAVAVTFGIGYFFYLTLSSSSILKTNDSSAVLKQFQTECVNTIDAELPQCVTFFNTFLPPYFSASDPSKKWALKTGPDEQTLKETYKTIAAKVETWNKSESGKKNILALKSYKEITHREQ